MEHRDRHYDLQMRKKKVDYSLAAVVITNVRNSVGTNNTHVHCTSGIYRRDVSPKNVQGIHSAKFTASEILRPNFIDWRCLCLKPIDVFISSQNSLCLRIVSIRLCI